MLLLYTNNHYQIRFIPIINYIEKLIANQDKIINIIKRIIGSLENLAKTMLTYREYRIGDGDMDFDRVIERHQTNSMKWDAVSTRYGEEGLWPMWVADMDFQAPKPVLQAMEQLVEHGIFGYHTIPNSLREATTSWLKRRLNWHVREENIVFTPGVVPAIHHMIATFTKKGDGIIIQTPVYYPFYSLIEFNERTLLRNPLIEVEEGHFTIDFEDLENQMKKGAKMLLFCSPHNPIGRVWRKEELEKVAELAAKYQVLVVSDEIHSDLILTGKHIPFATVASSKGVEIITCMAPSKTFNLAALQLSYAVFQNKRLQKEYETRLTKQFVGVDNPFATAAAEAAYRYGEEWLEQLLNYVRDNIQYLKEWMKEHIPKIRVIEPEGTYLVWLDMRALGMDAKELETWLRKEAKLALNDGHIFGTEGEGFARINLACPRRNVEEGLSRLYAAYIKRK